MDSLLLLLLLQIKHWYADFVLQTYMQTVKKGVWLHPVGISHSLEHTYTSMMVLLIGSFILPLNIFTIIWVCSAEGILHYLIDFTKVKYGSKDATKPRFWTEFGLDQLAHQITYLIMVAILLRL